MNDIRTITLDLDDTLWAIQPVIRRAEQRLYEWMGEHYPLVTQRFSRDDVMAVRAAVVAEYQDRLHDLTFMRRTVLARIGRAAGYDGGFVDAAFAVFIEARNDVELFPEARPALESLAERYGLIAVTNGNADLERIGIDDLFDDVISAARAGAAKPARQIFDLAVKAGGASAAQTLHVGDHPLCDVHGAREAGLRAIWVNREGNDWPGEYHAPDGEVQHIGELAGLLQRA